MAVWLVSLGQACTPPLGGVPFTPDAAADDGPATGCLWQGYGDNLRHFTFVLTTPDGLTHVVTGGGGGPTQLLDGRVTELAGNTLGVDTCLDPQSCQPNVYRFALCASRQCSATVGPGPIDVGVAIGRHVRVAWRLDNYQPTYCPGLYWLALYDAEPGATEGNLLFVGSGGRNPTPNAIASDVIPFEELPFAIALAPLSCNHTNADTSGDTDDDYAFSFSSKAAGGTPLRLATGESGVFAFVDSTGKTQRLELHCLSAVQLAITDNYWNWDFWGKAQ